LTLSNLSVDNSGLDTGGPVFWHKSGASEANRGRA